VWHYQNAVTDAHREWANVYRAPVWEEVVAPTLEGVYLKGQGVVYTATLTSLQPAAKTETPKPVSEWESVRRQLRNEQEESKKPEETKPPTLSDALLKVLAENGHHFSQLGENESLTVVLTVHEAKPTSSPQKSSGGGAGGSAKTESKPATGQSAAYRSQVRDLELLGDLHLKQGQNEEALKAFQQAVEVKELDPNESATLYRKLAQCYLALEKIAEARAALDKAAEISKNAQEAAATKNKQTTAKSPTPTLPIKLIVSAPKKLLVEIKGGRITFDDFRRQALVETLRFGENR
jgi:tetratricopeptide (TPR) repeat protein